MKFPDTVIILRPTSADAYGNDLANYEDATQIPQPAFLLTGGRTSLGVTEKTFSMLMPKTADLQDGDRFRINGDDFNGTILPVRSPSALKMYNVKLSRVED